MIVCALWTQHQILRWLIRRHNTTGELAFYRCWTPGPATLAQLVRVAGVRWIVEESFQAGKGQVGLDQHQVRRWTSWHRFITLALAALAVLAICAADAATKPEPDEPTTPAASPSNFNHDQEWRLPY